MNFSRWLDWITGGQTDGLTALHFEWSVRLGAGLGIGLLIAAALGTVIYYRPRLSSLSPFLRWLLVGLRTASVALALFLLLNPCLVGDWIQPGDRYIVLLFDDSQSMRVVGEGGQTRGERLLAAYAKEQSDFDGRLRNRYQVVSYRFGEGIASLEEVGWLQFSQNASGLIQAIRASRSELEGFPIAAMILFSDGVQQNPDPAVDSSSSILPGVPVYTVGVGDNAPWRDYRIEKLSVNQTHFDRSPVNVHADIAAEGFAGETAQAVVMQEGRIIETKTFSVELNEQSTQVHFEFTPAKKEWLKYELRVGPGSASLGDSSATEEETIHRNESTPQNNVRPLLVDYTQREYRILYYGSRPNWEHRFLRRAMQEDAQLQLSSLVLLSKAQRSFVFRGARTTLANPLFEGFDEDAEKVGRYDEPIYLRLGLGETELVKGFPAQKDDLFSFQLLIVGDVEWEDFSAVQMKLIRDFVEVRGGTLLVLGGEDKFSSGALMNGPIRSMLPIVPSNSSDISERYRSDFFRVQPSIGGALSGTWSLSADLHENESRWNGLPDLFGLNIFGWTRPGATAFAFAQSGNEKSGKLPFFVVQRFGNGKCAVLATDSTWPWRMRNPEESNAHERLWRQWIRSLVENVPEPIQFLSSRDSYWLDDPVSLQFRIRNPQFEAWESARVTVTIQTPSQKIVQPGVEESIQEAGIYTCEWTPVEAGKHELTVQVSDEKDETVVSWTHALLAVENQREFENARYNPDLLAAIAAQTGGRFFSLDRLNRIPDAIPWESSEERIQRVVPLWHNPAFFAVLAAMFSTEWYLRRKHGQP